MIIKALIVSGILGICFITFGCGVLFFGKKAKRNECGTPPKETIQYKKSAERKDPIKKFECPSQKAGLCAQEDDTGGLDMANKNRLYEIE